MPSTARLRFHERILRNNNVVYKTNLCLLEVDLGETLSSINMSYFFRVPLFMNYVNSVITLFLDFIRSLREIQSSLLLKNIHLQILYLINSRAVLRIIRKRKKLCENIRRVHI